MKSIKYFLILTLGFILAQSCTNEEDDLFNAPSAERMNAALKEAKETLIAAPNGWLMEYYAEKEPQKMGGFTYFCKFDENLNVEIATEVSTSNYPAKTKVKSMYGLIADMGPVLTFNTYNEIFHLFSEPRSSNDRDGDAGDYEFILDEVTPDTILMRGKRYGNKIVMTRLDESVNWDAYIDAVLEMDNKAYYPEYKLIVNGQEVGFVTQDYNTRLFSFYTSDASFIASQNGLYTPEGIRFYEPVTIDGVTIANMEWDVTTKTFKSDNVVFEGYYPEDYRPYEEFIGTYSFSWTDYNGANNVSTATLKPLIENQSFIISGTVPFDYKMTYDRSTGRIYVASQLVRDYGDFSLHIFNWMGGTSLNLGTDFKYIAEDDHHPTNPTLTFKSNTLGSSHIGYLFIILENNIYYLYDYKAFFSNVVMKKQ